MIEMKRRNPATVSPAETGGDVLFLGNDGVYYTKDSNGVTNTLGNGIVSIVLVGVVGLVKTYRITYSSGSTYDFSITDGRGISSITPPASPGQPGATDVYTITYNDGSTSTFSVYNGVNGAGLAAVNNPTSVNAGNTSTKGTRTAYYAMEDHQHGVSTGVAVGLNGGSTSTEGSTTTLARSDHTHAISNGGTPSAISPGATAAQGTSTSLARADHTHGITTGSAVGLNGGTTSAEGTGTSFARNDHTHAISNGGVPTTISPNATAAQGTSTSLARSDHTHAIATGVPVALNGSAAEGTSTSFARSDHVHPYPSAANVGADPAGASTSAVNAHVAAADPHPQYLTQAEGDAAYSKTFWYDVTRYGILPTNTATQNVTAWNSLYSTIPVNATIYFPSGTYDFDSELTLNRNVQIMITGDGKSRSILRSTSTTANLFYLSISAYYYTFEELGFASPVTKTAGAFIGTNPAAGDNAYLDIRRCEFKNYFLGVALDGVGAANVGTISECLWGAPAANATGLRINGANINAMVTNCTINQQPGSAGVGTCVDITQSGAVQFTGCDFIGGQYTLQVRPTAGQVVSALYFANCFFDQAAVATVYFSGTGAASRIKFVQCGITNGNVNNAAALRVAGTGTGTNIPEALDFQLCDFYNAFGSGILTVGVDISGCRGIDLKDCRISGFSTGVSILAYLSNGITNFNIQGCTIGPTENFPGNQNGIVVSSAGPTLGPSNISYNDLSGNTGTPFSISGAAFDNSLLQVVGNLGLVCAPLATAQNQLLATAAVAVRAGNAVVIPAGAVRAGTAIRLTARATNSATVSTQTITVRYGTANTNADTAILTQALAAGTAAVGGALIVADVSFISNTSAMVSLQVYASGGFGGAIITQTLTAPVTVSNVLSYLGLYISPSQVNVVTIRTAMAEVIAQ